MSLPNKPIKITKRSIKVMAKRTARKVRHKVVKEVSKQRRYRGLGKAKPHRKFKSLF